VAIGLRLDRRLVIGAGVDGVEGHAVEGAALGLGPGGCEAAVLASKKARRQEA